MQTHVSDFPESSRLPTSHFWPWIREHGQPLPVLSSGPREAPFRQVSSTLRRTKDFQPWPCSSLPHRSIGKPQVLSQDDWQVLWFETYRQPAGGARQLTQQMAWRPSACVSPAGSPAGYQDLSTITDILVSMETAKGSTEPTPLKNPFKLSANLPQDLGSRSYTSAKEKWGFSYRKVKSCYSWKEVNLNIFVA